MAVQVPGTLIYSSCARRIAPVALALLFFAAPGSAHALLLDSTVGLRAHGGANLSTDPTGAPGDGLGFRGPSAGYAWGYGAYYELRLLSFVGFEVGATWETGNLWRNIDIHTGLGTFKVKEKVTTKQIRVPLLLRLALPLGFGRLSLAGGPELLFPRTVDGVHEASGGSVGTAISTVKRRSTLFTGELGLTISVLGLVEIPIGLRASKNLSQPTEWSERVQIQTSGNTLTGYTVDGRDSWDIRLTAGVGFAF